MVQWIMARVLWTALIASLLCALAACHRHSLIIVPASAPGDPALSIAGDPESASGAPWTPGARPFPALVLHPGAGGNARSYGRALGSVMRTWGLVCIAVNYTHVRGALLGAPGTLLQQAPAPGKALCAAAAGHVLAL